MAAKTVLVVLALLCTAQTMEASVISDLGDKVQQMMAGGLTTLENSIADAVKRLEDALNNAGSMVKKIMDGLSQRLNSMVDSANKIGTDVSECMKKARDEMEAISQESETKFKKCVLDIMDAIKPYINKLNDTVTSMRSQAKDEMNKVTSCAQKSFFPMVSCAGELAHAGLVIGQMGTQVPPMVAEAEMQFPQIMQQLIKCSLDVSMYAEKAAMPVIQDTMKCVRQKVSDAMTTAATNVNTPVPAQDTPAPAEDTPAPVEDTPVPVEDTPAPAEDTPAPVEDTPAPVEDTPAPVEEKPAEEPTAPAAPSS